MAKMNKKMLKLENAEIFERRFNNFALKSESRQFSHEVIK